MAEKTKREIPSALKRILDLDVKLTKDFLDAVKDKFPLQNYRHHYKFLEISCHGVPWLAFTIFGLYTFDKPELFTNLLVALLLDIVVVAVMKAFTSFPSGHATRAILAAVFFIKLYPLSGILFLPLDVVGGIVIGLLEAFVMNQLWLSDSSARYIIQALGGEDPWSSA